MIHYLLYLICLIEVLQPRYIHFTLPKFHSDNCIKYEKNGKINNLRHYNNVEINKTMPLKVKLKRSVSCYL